MWKHAQQVKLKKLKDASTGTGFYYGLSSKTLQAPPPSTPNRRPRERRKPVTQTTLDEVRTMRLEMEFLRKELAELRNHLIGGGPEATNQDRLREYDALGAEIERWAKELVQSTDGWTEVACNKMFRSVFNRDGRTRCFLQWQEDSRSNNDDEATEPGKLYPLMKVQSIIDAPLEQVCTYLSQEQRLPEYNDLVVRHKDLEEISPHSKIVWGQTPQILFIAPRNLVTFCHHRWLRDGTQVLVNQSVKHDKDTSQGPRAYALRGANFIGRDPNDPDKTLMTIVTHASPGKDIPAWACQTAVKALAPIEPFKLFHKINQGVQKAKPSPDQWDDETEMVSSRSARPAGMAQMGYAAFWPQGGGAREAPHNESLTSED